MAISVTWGTKIINVNKIDMVLIDAGPPKEIYQLDVDVFRLALKALEDDPEGMPFLDTHRHVTTTEVSGAVLARVVEIINGYTVEFEDGQYAVNLVGANNNIGDVTVVNQVSVRSSNSAGLQDLNSLQAASFSGGQVALDITSPYDGTTFPVGTRAFPVNNAIDALVIADDRGLVQVGILSSMTMSTGDWSEGYVFIGDSPTVVTMTLDPLTNITTCEFRNMTIQGTLDGGNTIRDCKINDIDFFNGEIHKSSLNGKITLGGGVQASLFDCWSHIPGGAVGQHPHIDMGDTGNNLALRGYVGGLGFENCAGTESSLDFLSGRAHFESSCTGGVFWVRGNADVDLDTGVGTTIYDLTLNSEIGSLAETHKIIKNKTITDPSDGKMKVYDDDDTGVLYQADIYEDAAGTIPYGANSTQIERRERLQ